MNKGDQPKRGPETIGEAAARLLAGLERRIAERTRNQPRFLVTAETRGLGLSEEKNRRQSPQAVNDNGEEWPRASHKGNASQARGQVPCAEGGGWQGYDAVRVVVIATKLGMRLTATKADSNPETFTMLDLNSNALWESK